MPRIVFVQPNGERIVAEGEVGDSIMRVAVKNAVPGIVGECGGCLNCATCHAYIEEPDSTRFKPPSEDERVMVECAMDVRPSSRLTCQIVLTAELDECVVRIPKSQY